MFEDRYICTNCGTTMRSPKKVSGMGCWVTTLLFLLFVGSVVTLMWPVAILILFVDAVIYYATLKKNCCPECKGKECVIPLNTPMGQKLMRDFKSAPPAVASTAEASKPQETSSDGKIVYDPKTHEYVRKYGWNTFYRRNEMQTIDEVREGRAL